MPTPPQRVAIRKFRGIGYQLPGCRLTAWDARSGCIRRRSLCISSSLKNASLPGMQDKIVPHCLPLVSSIAASRLISRPSICAYCEITQTFWPAPFWRSRATSSAAVWATFAGMGWANRSSSHLKCGNSSLNFFRRAGLERRNMQRSCLAFTMKDRTNSSSWTGRLSGIALS